MSEIKEPRIEISLYNDGLGHNCFNASLYWEEGNWSELLDAPSVEELAYEINELLSDSGKKFLANISFYSPLLQPDGSRFFSPSDRARPFTLDEVILLKKKLNQDHGA